jgi:hypothetical protein
VITNDIEAALRRGVSTAYRHARRAPTEPELVAGVFAAGLPELANRLITTAPGALLLQVKKGPPAPFATRGTAARQVELYEHWPAVEVFGSVRDVDRPPHRGAQFSYWDVCAGASACPTCTWEELIPGTTMRERLQDELSQVVTGTGGRPFVEETAVAASGDDWSALIWDLIRRSVNQAWTVARGAQLGGSRTWDAGVFVVSSSAVVPALVAEAGLDDTWRELMGPAWGAALADAPPLSPGLPSEPERSDEGGIPVIFTEAAGPLPQDGFSEEPPERHPEQGL